MAVDLDGTLATYSGFKGGDVIGKPIPKVKKLLDHFRDLGFRIIIHTVRGNTKTIKDWLHKNDIAYDYINKNPDQPPNSSHKPFAHAYLDDKAINAKLSRSEIDKALKKLIPSYS